MSRFRSSIIAIAAVAVFLFAAAAWAMPQYLRTFMDTYKPKPNTVLAKASCGICHISKTDTSKLNPYGQDLKKNLVGAKVTKVTLTKVENLSSAKDGVSNITKIKAGNLPGKPQSR